MSQTNQVISELAKEKQKKSRKPSENLAQGQTVIITARWILVLAGLVLVLWNPDPLSELRIQILVILLLAMANFYLQAQLLMKRPAVDEVVYGASAADLAVITALIIIAGGFDSSVYIFYFPAILAFSIVFPTSMTATNVGITMIVYATICLVSPGMQLEIVLARLLMIAAVAFCGNRYLRIEQGRRQAARKAQQELAAQIRKRQAAEAV